MPTNNNFDWVLTQEKFLHVPDVEPGIPLAEAVDRFPAQNRPAGRSLTLMSVLMFLSWALIPAVVLTSIMGIIMQLTGTSILRITSPEAHLADYGSAVLFGLVGGIILSPVLSCLGLALDLLPEGFGRGYTKNITTQVIGFTLDLCISTLIGTLGSLTLSSGGKPAIGHAALAGVVGGAVLSASLILTPYVLAGLCFLRKSQSRSWLGRVVQRFWNERVSSPSFMWTSGTIYGMILPRTRYGDFKDVVSGKNRNE